MQFTVESAVAPPVGRFRVIGELDLTAAPGLRSRVGRAVAEGCSLIVLDLGAVSFIDCAGVASLLGCRDDVEAAGARFTLQAMSARVHRLLALTGTSHRLAVAG